MTSRASMIRISGLLQASPWTRSSGAKSAQAALPITAAVALEQMETGALLPTTTHAAPFRSARCPPRKPPPGAPGAGRPHQKIRKKTALPCMQAKNP